MRGTIQVIMNSYLYEYMRILRPKIYVLLGLLLGVCGLLGMAAASGRVALLVPSSTPTLNQPSVSEANQGGISISEAKKQKPFPPAEVSSVSSSVGITISWKANCGDISSYTVYRRLIDNAYSKIYSHNPDQALEDNSAPGYYHFVDKKVTHQQNYIYAVTVTSSLGTESDKSEAGVVTIK